MRTDDLIADLAHGLSAVRPLPSPDRRAIVWALSAVPIVVTAVALFGARSDVLIRVTQWDYLWTLIAAGLVGVIAGRSALILAVPGAERSISLRTVAVSLLAIWGLALGMLSLQEGTGIGSDRHWGGCFLRVTGVGLVLATTLALMVRRAAALRPGLAGLFTFVASMALATIAVQLACPVDSPAHGLVGHYAPVVLLGVLGALFGRLVLTPFDRR